MSRIFLSHSSRNNAEAVALNDWLRAEGWDDVFLDIHPERGIAAGERWEKALHTAANRCEAVLFLVSRDWLASAWCKKELHLAHRLNKRLFGVLIEDVPIADIPADITGTWQIVRLAAGSDHRMFRVVVPPDHTEAHVTFSNEGLTRLRGGLAKAGLDARFFPWPPSGESDRPPYRGLKPLEAEDAGIFFGRDAPIVTALDTLRGLRESAPPRLLVILGASGAGKSSFLRAGLLPRLARDDRQFLPLPVLRPGLAALTGETGLLRSLEEAFKAEGLPRTRAELRRAVEGGAATLRPLMAALATHAQAPDLDGDSPTKPPALVLPIDQGEELFRAEGAEESAAFLTLLKDLLIDGPPDLIALFTIRSDAYEALQTAKALDGIKQQTLSLTPMPRGAYVDVIEGPASRFSEGEARLKIAPALTQALLQDIEAGGAKDALPLLAFTLERLFLEYGADGDLKLAEYDALGRIGGSIEAAVARAFAAADTDPRVPRDPAARLALLRRGLVPWLAGIDPETGAPRRRVARLSEIPEEARPLIDHLVAQRLLSIDVAAGTGERTIEPAHEALLRQWSLMRGWLEEDAGRLGVLEGVKRAARDWSANVEAEPWLVHAAGRLEDAERLRERPDLSALLEATDWSYLAACRARDTREREAKALQQKARVRLIGGAAAGLFAFAVFAGWQWWQAEAAKGVAVAATERAQGETKRAETALAQVEDEKSRTQDQLKTAKIAQSRFLMERAREAIKAQDYGTAALLLLEALPDLAAKDPRPMVDGVATELYEVLPLMHETTVLAGHSKELRSAVFSRDGTRILTASNDNSARLWDVATGKEIAVLRGHGEWVRRANFSPDGTRILTASEDKTARLWDAATGKEIAVLAGHQGSVESAAFSPDGTRVVTASFDSTARLWDATTGKEIAVLAEKDGSLWSVAFSPDGSRIVTSSSNSARLWDAATGKEIAVLRGHTDKVSSAAFSHDGTRIATASEDKTARLWDAATGKEIAVLRGHNEGVVSAAFSPDGARVITASKDWTACLWDAATGRMIVVLEGHKGPVWSAAFSLDGTRVVTASSDTTARAWDTATGKEIAILAGHAKGLQSAAFSPDGTRIVTVSDDTTARLWVVAMRQETVVLPRLSGHYLTSAAFSADGTRIVTTSPDTTPRLWDAATGKVTAVLEGHTSQVENAAFSPDGTRVVTASFDGTARLWDVAAGKEIAVLAGHTNGVENAAFSPDGTRIVTASKDKTARLWDVATGKEIAVLAGHSDGVVSAVFSPDGARVVTASKDKTARLWDVATGKEIAVLAGHSEEVVGAAFSPDGTLIVTASASFDKTARLWDAASGKEIAILQGHQGGLQSVAFSRDGTRIVTASDDSTARLWDTATGKEIAVLTGHTQGLRSAAFSPDGTRIVTAANDNTARLWDAATGKGNAAVLEGHTGEVISAAFNPDGTRILTASKDSTARVWPNPVSDAALIDKAIARVPRCLTPEQRETSFLDKTPPAWCLEPGKYPYLAVVKQSRHLANAADQALRAGDFQRALELVDRAIALAPEDLVFEINRAHALAFLGRGDEARAIYLRHRGKYVELGIGGEKWEAVLVADFAALRQAGRDHPLWAEIEAAFKSPAQ